MHLTLKILTGIILIISQSNAQDNDLLLRIGHHFDGIALDVFENGKMANRKVVISLSARKTKTGYYRIECDWAYFLIDPSKKIMSAQLFHHSFENDEITNVRFEPFRIAFTLQMLDRTMNIVAQRPDNSARYTVTGLGLWSIAGGSNLKVEWRQSGDVRLPNYKIVSLVEFQELP